MEKAVEVKTIKASTELQQKVGTGAIDEVKVNQAQKVIETNKVDFGPIAKPFLEQLAKATARAKQGVGDGDELLNGITEPIMNLKANAATFNFPVISEMTGTVLNFLEHVGKVDEEIITIVENLDKAVMVAVAQKMSGSGNKMGAALVEEFKGVCKRYVEKRL